MSQQTDDSESTAPQRGETARSSTSNRGERWYQRLKNWLWGYDFFISYHWASGGTYAVNLAAQLREKGNEVFLDRAEYAMGDKWKQVGEVALRNTQRLVLIATREAVFESKPVEREVVLFTDRSRHCIPIFFGDTFAAEEQESPGEFIVLDCLPDDTLYVEDKIENLPIGPTTEVVEKLVSAHGIMRRRKLREGITLVALSLITTFAVVASATAVVAWTAKNEAYRQKAISKEEERKALDARDAETEAKGLAERRFADMSLNNGHRAIHDDHKLGAGLLWYAHSLQAGGDQAASARVSARSLIGGLSTLLPRHSLVHDSRVYEMAFSPDSRTIVSVSENKKAFLWDATTGQLRGPPLKHGDLVGKFVFTPDSQKLATVCFDDLVRLWDMTTCQPIGEPLPFDGIVEAILFSPDGRVLAFSDSSVVRLWDTATGLPRGELRGHEDDVLSLAFSPNGETIATGSKDASARLWTAAGKLRYTLPHRGRVQAVSFTPNGEALATATGDFSVANVGEARIWNVETGALSFDLFGHEGPVNHVLFKPGSTMLATSSDDGKVRLWDTTTGLLYCAPLEHGGRILALALTRDGQTLASGSQDKTSRLWKTASGKHFGKSLFDAFEHDGPVNSVTFSFDDRTLATTASVYGHPATRFWDVTTGLPSAERLEQDGPVQIVSFSSDGRLCATSQNTMVRVYEASMVQQRSGLPLNHDSTDRRVLFSPDGLTLVTEGTTGVQLWDAATRKKRHDKPLPIAGALSSVVFSPDGRLLATSTGDEIDSSGEVRLWKMSGEACGEPLAHRGLVFDVSFSPDGRTLASACQDKSVWLWDITSGLAVSQRDKSLTHESEVESVLFSPDGRTLATVSPRTTAWLWDMRTGTKTGPLEHGARIKELTFSPDGLTLATASGYEYGGSLPQAKLWDVPTGKEKFRPLRGVSVVSFTLDGLTLGTGSVDSASLWDGLTIEPIGPPIQHSARVNSVSFSPNGGRMFATASGNELVDRGEARIWDTSTRQPCCETFRHRGRVRSVSFSADGRTLATASDDGPARLWFIPPPATDDYDRVRLSIEVRTGRTIENDTVVNLKQAEWLRRKQQLTEVGGDCLIRAKDGLIE